MGTIVFAGTASFAVPALQRLFEAGHTLPGVITQPDKPVGRGREIQLSPVKAKAIELHLPVYQPATLKDDAARLLFQALKPDMIVVVAYGKILPPWLVALPAHGVINLHGSMLPRYRGAAPIQWAIANGEAETGVCAMKIDEGLDTGPVYQCEATPIGPDETTAQVSERLAEIGSKLLVRAVPGILEGALHPAAQDNTRATYAPVLKKNDGHIDWSQPAQSIHNRVRAFNPWPGTVTRFRNGLCKVLRSRIGAGAQASGRTPGIIVADRKSVSAVCGDGVLLEFLEVQLPNRRPLTGAEFANGMRLAPDEKFWPVLDN